MPSASINRPLTPGISNSISGFSTGLNIVVLLNERNRSNKNFPEKLHFFKKKKYRNEQKSILYRSRNGQYLFGLNEPSICLRASRLNGSGFSTDLSLRAIQETKKSAKRKESFFQRQKIIVFRIKMRQFVNALYLLKPVRFHPYNLGQPEND